MIIDNFKTAFFIFIFYSFLGWVIEVIRTYILNKKFVNRGFLIGPYCPIYGFGILLITLLLKGTADVSGVFLKSILICSILEYFTSYIMEKIFKYRWWDYTNRKFNINGRICLETMIPFGLGACAVMYFINPLLFKIINMFNPFISEIIFIVLFVSIIIDAVLSITLVGKIKGIEKNTMVDSTEQLSIKIKEMIEKNRVFYKRVFDSFPNLKIIDKKKNK